MAPGSALKLSAAEGEKHHQARCDHLEHEMANPEQNDPQAPAPSADELRTMLLEQQMKKMDERQKLVEAEEKKRTAFAEDFLKGHVTEQERAMIRRLVMNAVKEGKMEAMVYSFSSRLCTDRGRAINNNDPKWPETLQGKAKELYDRYNVVARPQGYALKAMIINFPDGVPGDIGLFLNWAPKGV
jgi:hypothetical protein